MSYLQSLCVQASDVYEGESEGLHALRTIRTFDSLKRTVNEAEFIEQYDNCYSYDEDANFKGGQYGN